MSFAVSGLSSGLDTSALIDGLMFAERATVRRLESSHGTEEASLNAWTDIETRLNTLEDAVVAIRAGVGLEATSALSSDESVLRVSAQPSALAGSYAFTVDSLAAAQQVSSAGLASGAELVGVGTATFSGGFTGIGSDMAAHTLTGGTYTLTVASIDTVAAEATVIFDGVEQTVAVAGDGSFTATAGDGGTLSLTGLAGSELATGTAGITVVEADATTTVANLAAALNVAGSPVRAQLINTGDGSAASYRLVITSGDTGVDAAADVDVSALSLFAGGLTTLRNATDATVTVGGSLSITRPSNTIADLFDGLSIDLVGLSGGEDVEIVVSADADARYEAVSAVVAGVSDVLGRLSAYSSYDVEAELGGPLVGNFTVRSVQRELSAAMSTIVSSGGFALLSQIGVSIEQDGTYAIDETTLRDALATDALGVQQVLVGDPAVDDDGVFDVLAGTVEGLLSTAGRVLTAKKAAEENMSALDQLIANQEVRLVTVEDRYRRQFTTLETLIGQLQSQSGFLTSIIGQQGQQQ